MMEQVSVRDFFTAQLPYTEQVKIRKRVVLIPTPFVDFQGGACPECGGSGDCKECKGKGKFDHHCSCEYCDTPYEPCDFCNETGKCVECKGVGLLESPEAA